jgi:hypothetical protein
MQNTEATVRRIYVSLYSLKNHFCNADQKVVKTQVQGAHCAWG